MFEDSTSSERPNLRWNTLLKRCGYVGKISRIYIVYESGKLEKSKTLNLLKRFINLRSLSLARLVFKRIGLRAKAELWK